MILVTNGEVYDHLITSYDLNIACPILRLLKEKIQIDYCLIIQVRQSHMDVFNTA